MGLTCLPVSFLVLVFVALSYGFALFLRDSHVALLLLLLMSATHTYIRIQRQTKLKKNHAYKNNQNATAMCDVHVCMCANYVCVVRTMMEHHAKANVQHIK